MISAARARTLLARYQQDLLNMQDGIDGGLRSDRQVIPQLIQALESIAYGTPFNPQMNTGMSGTKINSSDPQQAIPALLGYLDQRFLETHFNAGGQRIITAFMKEVQAPARLEDVYVLMDAKGEHNSVTKVTPLGNDRYKIEGKAYRGGDRAIIIDYKENKATRTDGNPDIGEVGRRMFEEKDAILRYFQFTPPTSRKSSSQQMHSANDEISKEKAIRLLARYQNDFEAMQNGIDGGMRSDHQVLPQLIQALQSIAYGTPFTPQMNTGMTGTKINSSNPQQAIPALLDYLDKRFLETHLNAGGQKIITDFMKEVAPARPQNAFVSTAPQGAHTSKKSSPQQMHSANDEISKEKAIRLLGRYQNDLEAMQNGIDGGMRSDHQVLPQLIQALQSIAYGTPFTPQMNTGMTGTKINSSNPQQAIPALLDYLDKRFLETHLNAGGQKIITDFMKEVAPARPQNAFVSTAPQGAHTSKKSSPQQMPSANDQDQAKFIQQFILHHASGVTRPPLIQGDKVKIEFQNSNHLFEFQKANKQYMANIEVQVAGPGQKAFLTIPIAQIRQMENDTIKSKYDRFVTSNQENRKVDTLASTSSLSRNFKDRYKTCQGDFLKSTILKDFYEDLQKANTPAEVAKVVKRYEDDGRYGILATAQNSTMQTLSFLKTSSAKAFSALEDERLTEIKNEHKKGHACS